jgi:outer membrane biosynthesis protein TonB
MESRQTTNTLAPSTAAMGPNVYLGRNDFLKMLAVAFFFHVLVFWIASLFPNKEVIDIPVRALSFKLGDQDRVAAYGMPAPAIAAAPPPPAMEAAPIETPAPAPEVTERVAPKVAPRPVVKPVPQPPKPQPRMVPKEQYTPEPKPEPELAPLPYVPPQPFDPGHCATAAAICA